MKRPHIDIPPTMAELHALANRMTYHRAKAEAMGFKFDRIEVRGAQQGASDSLYGDIELRAVFTCICGRQEQFRSLLHTSMPGAFLRQKMNVAAELWRLGSFSRGHLLSDGYTPEQCDEIEAKGKQFDEECRQELGLEMFSPRDMQARAMREWR